MDNTQPVLAAWAASSSDATKVSKTITGLAVSFTSLIVLLVGIQFHVQLSASDVMSFGAELGTVGGFIWGISGFIIKMIHWFAKDKPAVLSI